MDAKYLQITESIKRQIRNGDYLIEKVPSERKLADSFGVSYMTARRAVQQLIEDSFFLRCENGRLAIGPAAVENAGRLNVVADSVSGQMAEGAVRTGAGTERRAENSLFRP